MTTTRSRAGRFLASSLILFLPGGLTPLLAETDVSEVSGQLVTASSTPLAGARLHLEDPRTGCSFVSDPAGTDGRFDVEALPPASYRVAVESNGGLYVVDAPLRLDAGESRRLRLSVRSGSASRGRGGRATQGGKTGGATMWSNPLTATLIVVGAAIVVGVIVDNATNDDETPASASAP